MTVGTTGLATGVVTPTPGPGFGDRVAFCDSLSAEAGAVADELAAGGASVVVLGSALATGDALALATELDRRHPEIATVLVARATPTLWRRVVEAGVRHVVAPDASPDELRAVVDQALERADRQQANAARRVGAADEARARSRVITVLSPKGGVGKTTVATNLAAGLAQLHPNEVAIVDLDLQFGDVADSFLLEPPHSMADLSLGAIADPAAVKMLLSATASGLYALCAPDDPAAGEEVPIRVVGAAIDALAGDLAYVVIDTGAGIDAPTLAAVERSTDLVLVGSLDVPSVRSVRKLVTALDRLGLTEARRHVVLNRADSRVGVRPDDVVGTLGMPIAVAVPSSRTIPSALNSGQPIVLGDPRSPAAKAFQQLVGLFTDVPAAGRRRRPLSRSAA